MGDNSWLSPGKTISIDGRARAVPDSIPSILAGQGCCVINGPVLWSVKQECKKWLFMFMSGGRVTRAKRDPNLLGECKHDILIKMSDPIHFV